MGTLDSFDALSEEGNVFIQWKGTDACFDLWCDCGVHLHMDGYFAYAVKCGNCGAIWQMPQKVKPVKVKTTQWTPILLEEDED